MWWKYGAFWAAVLAAGVLGCGKSEAPPSKATTPGAGADGRATPPKMDDAAVAVTQFLEAVRTGNDQQATQMLSATARSKLSQLGNSITPQASDTARFVVGKVEHVAEDGARVACDWTDLDDSGKPETRHALWVVRREAEGWRVVGMAATVFEGEPPLLLNFEDPEDVLKKQEWLRAEVVRRSRAEKNRETTRENPGENVLR